MATEFDDSGEIVELRSVTLRVPGYRGTATERSEATSGRRGEEPPIVQPVLVDRAVLQGALARQGLLLNTQVEIELNPLSATGGGSVRSNATADIELEVPAPAEDEIQVVLAEQDGVLSWHFSQPEAGTAVGRRGRAANGDVFVIPNKIGYTPVQTDEEKSRGLVAAVGRKILKVFVYKVTDPLIKNISDHIAGAFEKKNRPYGVRMVTPENYMKPGSPTEPWPVDWELLSSGKALLLIHGTFSTAHGAFGSLDVDTIRALCAAYGGRVFAFNHFTISEDPTANVKWLASSLPAGIKLNIDILCHSRGGLVARCISENASSFGNLGSVTVGRVVMVGVPNEGTVLADPDHMTDFIDRITNVVGLVEAGSGPLALVGEFLDGVLTIVKIIGHGALKALQGLASMNPEGGYVGEMNKRSVKNDSYYAVTADYDPPPGNFRDTITKEAGNAVIDRVFNQANDLVVPTDGVYDLDLSPAFPIPAARILHFPKARSVMHTTYFAQPETRSHLVSWLLG